MTLGVVVGHVICVRGEAGLAQVPLTAAHRAFMVAGSDHRAALPADSPKRQPTWPEERAAVRCAAVDGSSSLREKIARRIDDLKASGEPVPPIYEEALERLDRARAPRQLDPPSQAVQ